jgi:hypothetical protein
MQDKLLHRSCVYKALNAMQTLLLNLSIITTRRVDIAGQRQGSGEK